MASAPKKSKKNKRADVDGWCPTTLEVRLKNMKKNKTLGDWRRDVQLHELHYKVATIRWNHRPTMKTYTFPGPVPVGMENLLTKLESAQNRTFNVIPLAVREEFDMAEGNYKPSDYEVEVSFSTAKYGNFRILYCKECTTKANLREKFWSKFPDKLPSDNISLQALMAHWDDLGLSWNSQDVLGCVLPNDPKHFALVNARRMIQRPIVHYDTVHRATNKVKKNRKSQIQLPLAIVPSSTSSSSSEEPSSSSDITNDSSVSSSSTSSSETTTTTTTTTTSASADHSFSMKINQRKSQLRQTTIIEVGDPRIDFKGHFPNNTNEEMALGHALKIVHVGANKMISSAAVLENYQSTMEIKREQWEYYRSLNADALRKGVCVLPRPITVRLNAHNINDGYEAILSAYRNHNNDMDNPYRVLEKVHHWGFIHDATSHWVKELNTVILRAVDEQGNISKVPFNFRQVPGSLTGEVLTEEIMDNISSVRKVKNNAAEKISDALISSSPVEISASQEQIEELRVQLKEAANALDFVTMETLKKEIQDLQNEMSNSQHSTITENTIIPKPPHYFSIATLKGVDHSNRSIYLEIKPEHVPTSICGDRCSTNVKANRLVTEWYGLTSPEADCSSHAASGTIRRTCTSATMNDPEAVRIYTALRKVLKHFSMSAKSTELLNKALDALNQHNIHMLVWGGTRMAGFLDGCRQSSSILVPFLDTLIAGKIREEESAVILSPKGLFTLELFADLHPVFSNQYLHCVDSDKILSCEVYDVAQRTAQKLVDPSLATPKADNIFKNLSVDANNNVCVTLVNPDADEDEAATHTHILNEKLTRHRTFERVKEDLLTTKSNILQRLNENITDQVDTESIFYLWSVFDLKSRESLEEKCEKLKALYEIYGKDKIHLVSEKWFEFNINITYKARLKCSYDELVAQFKIGHDKMTALARELRLDRDAGGSGKLTQYDLWVKFIRLMGMQCPDLCNLVLIMISIPPNSGYVERAYSYLEMICQKKRNQMSIEKPLKELFFLALLKLKPKDCQGYSDEIKILANML